MNSMSYFKVKTIIFLFILQLILTNCQSLKPGKADLRKIPADGRERALQNLKEGKGIRLSNIGKDSKTNYEFSTSNPMWRASLEILDFMPMSTVDYSGGVIITDWYNNDTTNEEIKITVRFLSTEVAAENVKVIVHRRNCKQNGNCTISLIKSQIEDELASSIIQKAALFLKDTEKTKR